MKLLFFFCCLGICTWFTIVEELELQFSVDPNKPIFAKKKKKSVILFVSFFKIYYYYIFSLQYCIGFAIHQHASATDVHVFPILNPTSHLPPHTIPLIQQPGDFLLSVASHKLSWLPKAARDFIGLNIYI